MNLAEWADIIGAMSFEALRGQIDAFDEMVMKLKPYPGIQTVGRNLRYLLGGSRVIEQSRGIRTQDALSLRSMPQIHGACRDLIAYAETHVITSYSIHYTKLYDF